MSPTARRHTAALLLAASLAVARPGPAAPAEPPVPPPAPSGAAAGVVVFPIRFDAAFLDRQLVEQAFDGAGGEARLLDDGTGCNYFVLRDPVITLGDGHVEVRARGEARASVEVGEMCLFPVEWSGIAEIIEVPRVEPGASAVRFEVVETELLGPDGEWLLVSSTLWDWVKRYVHPHMETRIDLRAAVDELRALLPLFLSPAGQAAGESLLASVQVHDVVTSPEAVRVDVRLEVPAPPAGGPSPLPAPEPTLAPEELRRWNAALLQWDAFVTFVVKATGRDTDVAELRAALLDVLVAERFELARALAGPVPPGRRDPVRALFVRTWRHLAPVVRDVADRLPAEKSLAYLSFVSAGDALVALDQLGPAVGLDISADGLRRLARILAPAEPGDPVAYSDAVDPELRELFGFGPPLPLPAPAAGAAGDAVAGPDGGAAAADEGEDAPAGGNGRPSAAGDPGARSTALEDAASPSPTSPGRAALAWLLAPPAYAAAPPERAAPSSAPAVSPPADLTARLNAWAPVREDAKDYLPLAGKLLAAVADEAVVRERVSPARGPLFRAAFLATAWQESCWRQFVRRGGELRALRSPVGSIGIMQVNQHVWRGFYDVGALARDIGYNARAGGEILGRYWRQAVAAREHEKTGEEASIARAAYAAYNGGPRQLSRYRRSGRPPRERRVDAGFAEKLRTMRQDADPLAVLECFVGETRQADRGGQCGRPKA